MTRITQLDRLRGHGTSAEYRALSKYAGRVKDSSVIVEIGTFRGKSACFLAHGSRGRGTRVYTIDPHDLPGERYPTGLINSGRDYTDPSIPEEAEVAIQGSGYGDRVTMVQGFSTDVAETWTGPEVGLLFIDGDHRMNWIIADFMTWLPHLTKRAYVLFDDYKDNFPDVVEFADNMIISGQLEKLELVDSLMVTRLAK